MIVKTLLRCATDTRGTRIEATAGEYSASWDYFDLIGDDGSTYAHRAAVQRLLALLGVDMHGPILVDAGEEGRGCRWVILNGPAMLEAAEKYAADNGLDQVATVHPVRMWTPMVPKIGTRVQLSPSYWPTVGQYATVVSREGKTGVWFKVRSETTGRTSKVSRSAIL